MIVFSSLEPREIMTHLSSLGIAKSTLYKNNNKLEKGF